VKIGVALGSNLGNRRKQLDDAVDFLQRISPRLTLSSYYVSQPVDCPPGGEYFYNAVALVQFDGDLLELLRRFQEFELAQGRVASADRQPHSPRPIDLDILYVDDALIVSEALTVPHPRLRERLFVLEPLAEIAPDWVLPGTALTAGELLAQCRAQFGKKQVCLKIV
jgi:2-amino-4-hydroxy-6-hydroxymethyldihydropteridine diphosphokinase